MYQLFGPRLIHQTITTILFKFRHTQTVSSSSMAQQTQAIDYPTLMKALIESVGDERKQAEEIYQAIQPVERLNILTAFICQPNADISIREFAAILLRRLLSTSWDDIKTNATQPQLDKLKHDLLQNIQINGQHHGVREKTCQAIAELAYRHIDEKTLQNHWPEFLTFLFECISSQNLELKECALTMFSAVPTIFANQQEHYLSVIHQMLFSSLTATNSTDAVKVAAVNATINFIIENSSNKTLIKMFSNCSVPMVEIFAKLEDEMSKEDVGQKLIELAEETPLVLRPALENVMQSCLPVLTSGSEMANTALELIVSLAEAAPGMIKKRASNYIRPIVKAILNMMSEIIDDDEWENSDSNDEDEEDIHSLGEVAMDRIALSLGGKAVLPILMEELPLMLSDADWKKRHAALMAFSSSGEGCRAQLLPMLEQVVTGITPYLGDPHPRVRYAACNTIGQMATDFSPDFEEQFHDKILPALLAILSDFSSQKVQAHAGAALVNVFEECPQEILVNYLDSIAQTIEAVLKTRMNGGIPKEEGQRQVVEQLITTLSGLADAAQEHFQKYYEKFMPCLKFIIVHSEHKKESLVLRGKAIECFSLIGMVVGKEKFIADANDLMKLLMPTLTGKAQLADDDPQLSYMIAAWARICSILGSDFERYLPYVMGPVLKAASIKVEIALFDEEDRKNVGERDDWAWNKWDEQQSLGIRTAGLEEKATACSMLVCYARVLKQGFVNHVEETAKVLVPLLKFPFHDDVRLAASECMPYLLESAKARGDEFVLQLWEFICTDLFDAIMVETEFKVLNEMLESLGGCMEKVGPKCLNEARIGALAKFLDEKFKEHFDTLAKDQEDRKDEDYDNDNEDDDDDSEDEDNCLKGLAEVIHALFCTYKEGYLPFFELLLPHILKLANDQTIPWVNRQIAICILDDVIEYSGGASIKYQEVYLPVLLNGITDKRKEIRQASLYGVGQLAQQLGPTFAQFFQTTLPSIVQLVNDPQSRSNENILATENAIAAVTRILKYCPNIPNHAELMQCWLQWLPIWDDETEVPGVLEYFITLIEQNHPIIMGQNSSNLTRLVYIIAEVFARTLIEHKSELGQRLVNFLRLVQADPAASACFSQLSAPHQEAVKQVLTS